MNFIKKGLMFFLLLMSCSVNTQCMKNEIELDDFSSSPEQVGGSDFMSIVREQMDRMPKGKVTAFQRILPFIYTADFLTQCSSIYSIDSVNKKNIDTLAKLRTVFNVISIFRGIRYWFNPDKAFDFPGAKAVCVLNMVARCGYIFKDHKIWKKAKTIALNNNIRIDKRLKSKKIFHYIWLTLNYFGAPFIKFLFGPRSVDYYYAHLISVCSENYRRYLMYAMIDVDKSA